MTERFPNVARAWSERGRSECEALLALAFLPADLWLTSWDALPPAHREKLVYAFRRAIELGEVCALAMLDESEHRSEAKGL